MVAARSAAMGFNRLVDARHDGLNPRTAMRELPRGVMSRREATVFVVVAVARVRVRVVAAQPAVRGVVARRPGIVFWYSLAKRYTTYTQAFLGLAMAVAPVGGWLAAGGGAGWEPWLLGAAIGLWVGGFDVLYACQDEAFDRAHGLKSIPVRFGIANSLLISRVMHVAAVVCMALARGSGSARAALSRRRRACRGPADLRAVARQPRRSVPGQARLRPQRLRRHSLFRDDGRRRLHSLIGPFDALVMSVTDTNLDKTPRRIAGMFDAIAPRYDLLNTVLSAGLDRYWRRRAIRLAPFHRPGNAARRLHGHWRCGAGGCAHPRRGAAGGRRRLRGRDAGARPREGGAGAAVGTRPPGPRRRDRAPVAGKRRGWGDDRVRHSQRGAARSRVSRAFADAEARRAPGHSRVRPAGRARGASAVSLVFPQRPAADRSRRVTPRRGVFVPAGVGRRVPVGRGIRRPPARGRI